MFPGFGLRSGVKRQEQGTVGRTEPRALQRMSSPGNVVPTSGLLMYI